MASRISLPASTADDHTRLILKAAEYFGAADKAEEARVVRASLQQQREATVIAVIGEVGRGKTKLVEALSRAEAKEMSIAEEHGKTAVGAGGESSPEPAAPTVAHSFIDCPSFNGAETEITKAAVSLTRSAGVVVFVLDATSPITEPELATLRELAKSAPSLVVAISKKDKNLLGWREVESATQQQIQQHLGALAAALPVVSVSPLRYLAGLEGDPTLADAVIQDSGIPRLRKAIAQARTQLHRDAHGPALRQALLLLESEIAELDQELASEGGNPAGHVQEKKAELEYLSSQRRRGQQILGSGLNQARSEAVTEAEAELTAFREKWRDHLATSSQRYIRTHRETIYFRIEAELNDIFEKAIRHFMARAREEYVQVTEGIADWHSVVEALNERAARIAVTHQPGVEKVTAGLVDPSLVSLTIAGGFGLTHVLSFLPGVGAAVIGSGGTALPFVAMAGLWLGVNVYHRSSKTGRADLNKWLDQVLTDARRQVSHGVGTVYNELRPLVINQFNDDLELRILRTRRGIQQSQQSQQWQLEERRERRREAQKKSAYVAGLRSELLEQVNTGADA